MAWTPHFCGCGVDRQPELQLDPRLGSSTCCGCSPKKTKKKKVPPDGPPSASIPYRYWGNLCSHHLCSLTCPPVSVQSGYGGSGEALRTREEPQRQQRDTEDTGIPWRGQLKPRGLGQVLFFLYLPGPHRPHLDKRTELDGCSVLPSRILCF